MKYFFTIECLQSSDINECELNHPCEQECSNNIGSFECVCNPGYTLNADGMTCEGIATTIN